MISNKDLRVEGSNLIINGEKHPLDPAVNALINRANTVQGKLSALDTKITAIEALKKTASGNPISLTGAAEAYAMGLSMTIEPVQDLHGYSKPWPGGGGKNLIDWANPSFSHTYNNAFYMNVIVNNGNIGAFHIQPNTVYTISYDISTGVKPFNASVGTGNGAYETNLAIRNGINASHVELTFLAEESKIDTYGDILALRPCYYDSAVSTTFTITNFQLEIGSAATSFEPYSNICPISGLTSGEIQTTNGEDTNTAVITFGQTIYGGSVNFKTGEVTVTHGMVDLGDLGWVHDNQFGYDMFYTEPSVDNKALNWNFLCDCFKTVESSRDRLNNFEIGTYNLFAERKRFAIRYDGITTTSAFITAVTGHMVCYELETPVTLTLTPAELELLKGANTISGNGVNINIGYIGR